MSAEVSYNILFIAATVLLLAATLIATSLYQLVGTRYHRPRIRLKDRDDLPLYLQKLYQDATAQLCAQGFKVHHCQISRDLIAHEHTNKWSLVLVNTESRVFAEITPATTFLDMPGYEVNFWSIDSDSVAMVTLNGRSHTLLSNIPGADVHDPLARTLPEQYSAHLDKLKAWSINRTLILPDPVGFVRRQQKLMDAYFLNLIHTRAIVSTGNNEFRLRCKNALVLKLQTYQAERQIRKTILNHSREVNPAYHSSSRALMIRDHPVEAEVQSYIRYNSTQHSNPVTMLVKLLLLIVTLPVTYLTLNLTFSWQSVLIIASVILLHEFGHILFMYFFRYRNYQIFFIPLGKSRGNDEPNIDAWKQIIIYLMGPLPGIVAGLTLIILVQHYSLPWLYETGVILVVINYLSLLPIIPLDGGHILRLTAFKRFAFLKTLFSLVSGMLFVVAAQALNEPAFWLLAVFIFVSLPFIYLESRVLKEYHRYAASEPLLCVNDRLARFFQTLRAPKFKSLHFSRKCALARSLSNVILQPQYGKTFSTAGLMSLYIGVVLATPPAFFVSTVGFEETSRTLQTFYTRFSTKASRVANPVPSKKSAPESHSFSELLHKAESFLNDGNIQSARKYIQLAEDSVSDAESDESLANLYKVKARYYRFINKPDDSEFWLQKSIDLYLHMPDKPFYQLALSFQHLAVLKHQQNKLNKYEGFLKKAFNYAMQTTSAEHRTIIPGIVEQLMDHYHYQKKFTTAQAFLQRTLHELADEPDAQSGYVAKYLHTELGWMYGNKGFVKTAERHFNNALSLISDVSDNTAPYDRVDLYLAIASINYEKGNIEKARTKINLAARELPTNNFSSLKEYINRSFSNPQPYSKEKMLTRKSIRWNLVFNSYQSLTTNKSTVSNSR